MVAWLWLLYCLLRIALLADAVANAALIAITTYIYSFQRQRSISLSSLDSENELELDGKSCTGPVGVGNRACRSQTSTHSLNEADLVQVITKILRKAMRAQGRHSNYIANFSLTERISEDSHKEG